MATGLGGPCTERKREETAPLGSWGRFAGASWEDGELETGWHLNTDENDPGGIKEGPGCGGDRRSWKGSYEEGGQPS